MAQLHCSSENRQLLLQLTANSIEPHYQYMKRVEMYGIRVSPKDTFSQVLESTMHQTKNVF